MLPKKIISLQHSLVKHWSSLRAFKTYREETKRVLVVGKRPIQELSHTFPIRVLLTTEPWDLPADEQYLVTEPILKKISGLQQPDGFAAEFDLPAPQDLSSKKRLVILDGIADPGNLGTLLRTALALGWEGAILTPNTVDLFNDKALRASRGAPFYLPYNWLSPDQLPPLKLYLADLTGEPLDRIEAAPPLALILSREAQGPKTWAQQRATKVLIPMQSSVESLNVAAAGAILLYAMRPPL